MLSCKYNLSEKMESLINEQINRELLASHEYLRISCYFQREYVNLPGFYKFFKKSSEEETEHGYKLIEYLNKRGGKVSIDNIILSEDIEITPLSSLEKALSMELSIYENLLKLHSNSEHDPQFCDFIESEYLNEQIDAHKEISDMITSLKRYMKDNNHLGLELFDKNLQNIL
jgi:ferritin heavy chain